MIGMHWSATQKQGTFFIDPVSSVLWYYREAEIM